MPTVDNSSFIGIIVAVIGAASILVGIYTNIRNSQQTSTSQRRSDLEVDYARVTGEREECRNALRQMYGVTDSMERTIAVFRIEAEKSRERAEAFQRQVEDMSHKMNELRGELAALDLTLIKRELDNNDINITVVGPNATTGQTTSGSGVQQTNSK